MDINDINTIKDICVIFESCIISKYSCDNFKTAKVINAIELTIINQEYFTESLNTETIKYNFPKVTILFSCFRASVIASLWLF